MDGPLVLNGYSDLKQYCPHGKGKKNKHSPRVFHSKILSWDVNVTLR